MTPKINLKHLLFIFFVCIALIPIISNPIRSFYSSPSYDEINYYQPAVKGMQENGVIEHLKYNPDTKPFPFMYTFYLLDGSIFYTRILNYLLIIITTLLIFKLTGSKLAFLYPLIPLFLNGATLTAEIIKAMFLIASLLYIQYGGIFIGLATIFNPYAVFFGAMLNKKNVAYLFIICEIFAAFLLLTGLFFPYLYWLILYVGLPQEPIDWIVLILLLIFFLIGSRNKTILKYALISMIPVFTRPFFDHYYIVPFSILFVGYLLEINNTELKHEY